MNEKYLQIIKDEKDKEMVLKIAELIEKTRTAMSPIQIHHFVLNDVEYPTDYSKYLQSKLELSNRFSRIIDLYFDFKETEIEIRKIERKLENETDELERELLLLKKEREEIKLSNLKVNLQNVLYETRIFWEVFNKNEEFHNLSEEEALKLEAEGWAKKAMNMPLIFEERYGENFMRMALGEGIYDEYKKLRQKGYGILPREIFNAKQIKEKND